MSAVTKITEKVKQVGFNDGYASIFNCLPYNEKAASNVVLDAIVENNIPYTEELASCFLDDYKEAFEDGQDAAINLKNYKIPTQHRELTTMETERSLKELALEALTSRTVDEVVTENREISEITPKSL